MAFSILQQLADADLTTETGYAAARLRLAIDLARTQTAKALIQACRVRQMRHVLTGHQAAYALAVATLRPSSRRRRH